MLIPAWQMGQPRPWRNTSFAHDSQKRWCHMAPTRCMRHSQPRGRPRNSRRWQLLYLVQLRWHKLLLIHRNSLTSCKGGICDCPRCLSVCLLARLLENACMDLDKMLRHGRTSKLLSPIRIIVRIQEPNFSISTVYLYGRISVKFNGSIATGPGRID